MGARKPKMHVRTLLEKSKSEAYDIWLCNRFDEEERAGCFALIVFLIACDCKCSVALPHNAVGWSAACDCGSFCC